MTLVLGANYYNADLFCLRYFFPKLQEIEESL